jgi:hypothetical protein
MTSDNISAKGGSTAIGGDNLGSVVNVDAKGGANVNISVNQAIARKLPSLLGEVIAKFSEEGLSAYGQERPCALRPEIVDKIQFNCLPQNHHVIRDYQRHVLILEKCYEGVEQRNADARYLVHRKAGIVYQEVLWAACNEAAVPDSQKLVFIRQNAASLVSTVVDRLLKGFELSSSTPVHEEAAHLAVSLIVADAVIECEVLERPEDAIAT